VLKKNNFLHGHDDENSQRAVIKDGNTGEEVVAMGKGGGT